MIDVIYVATLAQNIDGIVVCELRRGFALQCFHLFMYLFHSFIYLCMNVSEGYGTWSLCVCVCVCVFLVFCCYAHFNIKRVVQMNSVQHNYT